MDKIDRKIIRELQTNGRLTNHELADRVGLSPSPCLRRVRGLEERGVIQGYTAIVDQEKFGLPINVFVQVKLDRPSEENIRSFEDHIRAIDEVLECYLMTGTNDYMLHVVSESLQTYERLMKEKLTKIPGIGSIESGFAFGLTKKKTTFPPLTSS
ncbi:MAG: Lrp/AsnC family transcriptional regulator [Alphaproteobacteria bacterium]|nr:MAG: Lrp/AsnC family transcriptional regulator [Alphaproteobacteria bacterium]